MVDWIKKWFSLSSPNAGKEGISQPVVTFRVPDGVRVYVIGDIHGCLGLLKNLHGQIAEEMAQLPDDMHKVVIYLGDYIDRGEDSRGVVELLLSEPLAGCKSVFLKGNHESEMENFLADPRPDHLWTQHGGMETALSYQVRVKAQVSARDRMRQLRDRLVEALPTTHQNFFANLQMSYEVGDYFMVHAGVRPGVPLDQQNPLDMLWIRDPFTQYSGSFGKRVVHGHSVTPEPITLPNRIGVDTGAYYTGKLSCLVLEADRQHFLTTGSS